MTEYGRCDLCDRLVDDLDTCTACGESMCQECRFNTAINTCEHCALVDVTKRLNDMARMYRDALIEASELAEVMQSPNWDTHYSRLLDSSYLFASSLESYRDAVIEDVGLDKIERVR